MPSRVKGAAGFRRLLKALPDAVRAELAAGLLATGEGELQKEQSLVPVGRGSLRSALRMKVYEKILRLRVGLIGKPVNRRFFYGWIVERGRLGQSVRVRRSTTKPYIMRVRGMVARPFVHTTPTAQLAQPFRNIWTRALGRAASGNSSSD
jgi:hypothetical protein